MNALARVLFHMQASDPDALDNASRAIAFGHIQPAMLRNRLVELRDLIALGIVGVEVIFACEDAPFANLAVNSLGRKDRIFHCLPIQNGQRTG